MTTTERRGSGAGLTVAPYGSWASPFKIERLTDRRANGRFVPVRRRRQTNLAVLNGNFPRLTVKFISGHAQLLT